MKREGSLELINAWNVEAEVIFIIAYLSVLSRVTEPYKLNLQASPEAMWGEEPGTTLVPTNSSDAD